MIACSHTEIDRFPYVSHQSFNAAANLIRDSLIAARFSVWALLGPGLDDFGQVQRHRSRLHRRHCRRTPATHQPHTRQRRSLRDRGRQSRQRSTVCRTIVGIPPISQCTNGLRHHRVSFPEDCYNHPIIKRRQRVNPPILQRHLLIHHTPAIINTPVLRAETGPRKPTESPQKIRILNRT